LIRVLDRILFDQDKRIRYHYVIVDYWGWKVSGEPKPGSDASEICFIPLKDIRKKDIHREVLETILMASELGNGFALPYQMEETLPVGHDQ